MIEFNSKDALWCKTPLNLLYRFSHFWLTDVFPVTVAPFWKPCSRDSAPQAQQKPSPPEFGNHLIFSTKNIYTLTEKNSLKNWQKISFFFPKIVLSFPKLAIPYWNLNLVRSDHIYSMLNQYSWCPFRLVGRTLWNNTPRLNGITSSSGWL